MSNDQPDVGAFSAEQVDTGLVTAAVTKPGLTPAGKEAAKGLLQFKPDTTMAALAALARDIAQDIYPITTLLGKHGLTQNQYDFISENNEFFKQTLASETKEWQSIASTERRIRLQALAALEDKMPSIASRMGAAAEKFGDVVEAAKFFAKVAGVDAAPGGAGGGGSGFTISIDLGADTRITIGPDVSAAPGGAEHGERPLRTVGEGQAVPATVPVVRQGPSDDRALRQIPAGPGAPQKSGSEPKG